MVTGSICLDRRPRTVFSPPGLRSRRWAHIVLLFVFNDFCQAYNYLNIYRTDLHQSCILVELAVDERSGVSFSIPQTIFGRGN